MKETHIHEFKLIEKSHLVHKYSLQRKKKGPATAKDTLKQYMCKCGETETVGLERIVL